MHIHLHFRVYALEKIKHDFHANKSVTDSAVIEQLIKSAEENLDIIRRQVIILARMHKGGSSNRLRPFTFQRMTSAYSSLQSV